MILKSAVEYVSLLELKAKGEKTKEALHIVLEEAGTRIPERPRNIPAGIKQCPHCGRIFQGKERNIARLADRRWTGRRSKGEKATLQRFCKRR